MASQWEHIKWIPGTRLMVDGFRYQNSGCRSYLLTHFHSDHTTGLTRSFASGFIYCTPITARLLRKDMRLPGHCICELPLDKPTMIEGTEVTPICANHCPGACMFLFKVKPSEDRKAQVILHTGDMRWNDSMAQHPALKGQTIYMLFMDTTYAKANHTHPPQDDCIALMAKLMRQEFDKNPKTLFVCGSYHIGKERAYLGAAKALGWKVWCDTSKRRVLEMLDLPEGLMACLADKPEAALIHVDFLGGLQPERLQKKLDSGKWTHAVGFRPTGWTYRSSGRLDVREEGRVKIYGIPYSEHSSWPELRSCVAALRPRRLVPTVNAPNPTAARNIVNRFADLMDLSGDRSRLDFFLQKRQKVAELAGAESTGAAGKLAGQPNVWQPVDRAQLITLPPWPSPVGMIGQAGHFMDLKAPGEAAQRDPSTALSSQMESAAEPRLWSQREENALDVCGLDTANRDGIGLVGEPRAQLFRDDESAEGFHRAPLGFSAICSGTALQPRESLANDSAAPGMCSGLRASAIDVRGSASGQIGLDVVDLTGVDVAEQEDILRRISEERRRQKTAISQGLSRKRKQSTLSCFAGR